jgi:hypothetical protein
MHRTVVLLTCSNLEYSTSSKQIWIRVTSPHALNAADGWIGWIKSTRTVLQQPQAVELTNVRRGLVCNVHAARIPGNNQSHTRFSHNPTCSAVYVHIPHQRTVYCRKFTTSITHRSVLVAASNAQIVRREDIEGACSGETLADALRRQKPRSQCARPRPVVFCSSGFGGWIGPTFRCARNKTMHYDWYHYPAHA